VRERRGGGGYVDGSYGPLLVSSGVCLGGWGGGVEAGLS
jgi:hypothetical protein